MFSDEGVKTVSLTCDRPNCNQSMLKILGAQLDVENLDPSFTHPGDLNRKIYIIVDGVPHVEIGAKYNGNPKSCD